MSKNNVDSFDTFFEIESVEFLIRVEYDYTEEDVGVYDKAPEDCYPSEPATAEIVGLAIEVNNKYVNADFLLEDNNLVESLIEAALEVENDRYDH